MTDREQLARPEALGEALKAMREAAGVELDAIVEETKVSRRVFELLEAGRYQMLPEKVFCKNFLKQYIRMTGCEESAWLEDFDLAWNHFEMSSGTLRLIDDTLPEPEFNWRLWLPVIAGALVIVVLLLVVVMSSRAKEVLPPDPRRSSAVRATPIRSVSTPTPFAVLDTPEVESPGDTATPVSAVVRVRDDKECWIHYRDHDGRTGQELLFGGTTRKLVLSGPALLTLGNADAATIIVGGQEYNDLGRAGQVAHFEVGPTSLTRLEPGSNGG